MKKRKKDLNANLLEMFGFLIYLSVGFVFILIIILGNIRIQEVSDPFYACGRNTEISLAKDLGPEKGITLKLKRSNLSDIRVTLENYGLEVISVSMNGKSPTMTYTVKSQYDDKLGYRLCQIKDVLAVSDMSFIR
jgi:hypothetical protein